MKKPFEGSFISMSEWKTVVCEISNNAAGKKNCLLSHIDITMKSNH